MQRFSHALLGFALLAMTAAEAAAQTCAGAASFSSGPVRVGGAIDVGNDAKQYGGQLAFGAPAGPFAAVSVGRFELDDVDEFGKTYSADMGYSIDMAGTGSLQVCPVLGFAYSTIKANVPGFAVMEVTSRAMAAGFMVGGVASTSPTLSVVPAAGVSYVHENAELESNILTDEETSDDYGVITLAAGFVFNQRVTVRPNIAIPVGLDDADPTFGIGIAFNFGARGPGR